MHPGHCAARVDTLNRLLEARLQMRGLDQFQEGQLRMGVGQDRSGPQGIARFQPHAHRSSAFDQDLADRSGGADVDTTRYCRTSERLGYAAHSAFDEGPASRRLLELTGCVIAVEIGYFGRIRAGPNGNKAIECKEALDVFRDEVLLQQAADRAEHEFIVELRLASLIERGHHLRAARGSRAEDEGPHDLSEAAQSQPELHKAVRVRW